MSALREASTARRSKPTMPTFATIGSEGSDHHVVLQQYLASHGITESSRQLLLDDFHAGARDVVEGRADYLLQCAVHPAATAIAGTYRPRLVVVDAFISPRRPMALVQARKTEGGNGRIAVQPTTQGDTDLSGWCDVVHEPTVAAVQMGLQARRTMQGSCSCPSLSRIPMSGRCSHRSKRLATRGLSTGEKPSIRVKRWSGATVRWRTSTGSG